MRCRLIALPELVKWFRAERGMQAAIDDNPSGNIGASDFFTRMPPGFLRECSE